MNNDPAVEAAHRARGSFTPMKIADIENSQVAAAREALKPIRELIDQWESTGLLDYGALRKLIYTTE